MLLKLDSIKTFCTVAECRNLVKASAKLGRTPSAISMALKQLEEDIGGELFQGERKTKLTSLGEYVLNNGLIQLESFRQFELNIQRFARGEGSGTIKILSVPSVTKLLLTECLGIFRQHHPNVHFSIGDMSSGEIIRSIHDKKADLGIISSAQSKSPHLFELHYEDLFADRLGFVCHKSHPLTDKQRITWQSAEDFEIILNPLCNLVEEPTIIEAVKTGSIEADNNNSILAILSTGIGFSILPESLSQTLPADLRFILPSDKPYFRQLLMVHPDPESLSPMTRRMIETIRNEVLKISDKLK